MSDPIVIFDTDCVLCSGMVAFVLKHERDPRLRFAGAWSEEGGRLAASHGFSAANLHETFLVITGGQAFTRSDGGIAILRLLRAPWRWLAVLHVLPRSIRDGVYDIVAQRRYRWFGRRQNCTVVPPRQRHRFIGVSGGKPG